MALSRTTAHADPSKAFFVRMLTRDISLDDCILDLVDNSVDGAWEVAGLEPVHLVEDEGLSQFKIAISFSDTEFRISDNCGGITLDQAADYAFTFGRRPEQTTDDYSVGVYGIGMKRAVFKLGEDIVIRSTYAENGGVQSFAVPIDVPAWLGQSDDPETSGNVTERHLDEGTWDFNIEESEDLAAPGVDIVVTELLPETSARLGDPTFEVTLRRILARDYMVPLMRGLQIYVNGARVKARAISFRENADFAPLREEYEDQGVRVEIVAGMGSLPPDSGEPDEDDRLADAESGWYVLCNGRVVLAADTSHLTGWGAGLPKWHPQYRGFVGVVLFSAADPTLLPMTTTKRSVDGASQVYRRALVRMSEPARAWIAYSNVRRSDLDTAKSRESQAQPTLIADVRPSPAVRLPTVAPRPPRERVANVQYQRPLKRMRALAAALGDDSLSYREVGIQSFEYAFKAFVEEE